MTMPLQSFRPRTLFIVPLGLAFPLVVDAASAQADCPDDCYCTFECATNDDCQLGMVCTPRLVNDCPDDLDTGCLEGESDDECVARVEEQTASECQRVEVKSCDFYWSGGCETDADCGDDRLACRPGQGCQPRSDRCDTDADCAEMWTCRDVQGFCTEDTDEHGACIDGMFQYRACSPAPYCGFDDASGGSASSGDNSADEQPAGEEQGATDDGSSEEDETRGDEDGQPQQANDDQEDSTDSVRSDTDDAAGCSVTNAAPSSGASWFLTVCAVGLVLLRRREDSP